MSVPCRIRTVCFESGERFPLLIDGETGLPLFYPTQFLIAELRGIGLATQTLVQAARSISVGLQILEYLEIDIDARLDRGKIIDLGEIDEIVTLFRYTQESIKNLKVKDAQPKSECKAKLVSFERVRMRSKKKILVSHVDEATTAIRLMYFRNYLSWRIKNKILSSATGKELENSLLSKSASVTAAITERIPSARSRSTSSLRQGMDRPESETLLEVVRPESHKNPWKNKHTKIRNQLIVNILFHLGIRRSEMLILKISDFDFRSNMVFIPRRPDDPEETRKDAPNTKTRDRLLALDDSMTGLIRNYILNFRSKVKGARNHGYLIVATGSGRPLTKGAIHKIFKVLRIKVSSLPKELSPHVLRHTWNENFSELMDEHKVSPAEEERLRIQQMGWADNSKSAATYTRRHTIRAANKASLEMQGKWFPSLSKKTNE